MTGGFSSSVHERPMPVGIVQRHWLVLKERVSFWQECLNRACCVREKRQRDKKREENNREKKKDQGKKMRTNVSERRRVFD